MVVRTADRIMVSEAQLAEAVRVFASALEENRLPADIEVALDVDPEGEIGETTLLIAHLREDVEFDWLWTAFPRAAERLREARLLRPAIALDVHLTPGW